MTLREAIHDQHVRQAEQSMDDLFEAALAIHRHLVYVAGQVAGHEDVTPVSTIALRNLATAYRAIEDSFGPLSEVRAEEMDLHVGEVAA